MVQNRWCICRKMLRSLCMYVYVQDPLALYSPLHPSEIIFSQIIISKSKSRMYNMILQSLYNFTHSIFYSKTRQKNIKIISLKNISNINYRVRRLRTTIVLGMILGSFYEQNRLRGGFILHGTPSEIYLYLYIYISEKKVRGPFQQGIILSVVEECLLPTFLNA